MNTSRLFLPLVLTSIFLIDYSHAAGAASMRRVLRTVAAVGGAVVGGGLVVTEPRNVACIPEYKGQPSAAVALSIRDWRRDAQWEEDQKYLKQAARERNQKFIQAAGEGNCDLVGLLIVARADINARNENGETALHVAAGNNHADMVMLLLQKGADVNACDNLGNTPLHKAAKYPNLEYGKRQVIIQLDIARAKKNAKNNNGETPLHVAAAAGSLEAVDWLLGTTPCLEKYVEDKHGKTPRDRARDALKMIKMGWRLETIDGVPELSDEQKEVVSNYQDIIRLLA